MCFVFQLEVLSDDPSDPDGGTVPSQNGAFRPINHDYTVGRDDPRSPVRPGEGIGAYIDDNVYAGHTFGYNHDRFVGDAVNSGFPDWLVNIPSMLLMYVGAVAEEFSRGLVESLGLDPGLRHSNDPNACDIKSKQCLD